MKIKIAICDDIKEYRGNVISCCEKYFGNKAEISCFSSGEELLASTEEYDILFLDIEMSEIDGIMVKNQFEAADKQTKIIFLTSYEERVFEAFGKNVVAFLRKPLKWDAYKEAMDRLKLFEKEEWIEVDCDGQVKLILVSDIRYIEAQDKYTKAVTRDKEFLVRKSMKEWEVILPEDEFCRVNRSFFINLDLFERHRDEIVIKGGKKIKLSRKNKAEILEKYRNYLRRKALR